MKRSAPLTRAVFKSRALGPTIGLCRDQRLEERAARALASATPRASVMACATAYAAPIAKECAATSEAYRRAVASLPCAACGIYGYSQHAHGNEGKGLGLKTDDRTGVPLCCARPGEEGCHIKFDQYRLLPGGRDAHREAMRTWGAQTRAMVHSLGLWPKNLPPWPGDKSDRTPGISKQIGS
ncbi:hypothetical protein [Acidovorax sp. K2F]|uniref:hypothetical protein n=1 Tax=Acidovorax sp. K2F TaxID=2978125 RepID=UPI0021B0F165|nr:hypothetical protein [Acidovorax sp. K2F]MCT6719446.1 hypothetical protein [Acidovorax sp. K2F]